IRFEFGFVKRFSEDFVAERFQRLAQDVFLTNALQNNVVRRFSFAEAGDIDLSRNAAGGVVHRLIHALWRDLNGQACSMVFQVFNLSAQDVTVLTWGISWVKL